eukprot:5272109-Prymnesium_polylepis.1
MAGSSVRRRIARGPMDCAAAPASTLVTAFAERRVSQAEEASPADIPSCSAQLRPLYFRC